MMFANGARGFGGFVGGHCFGGPGGFGFMGGPIMMLLFVLIIGLIIYAIYKSNNKQSLMYRNDSNASDEALNVLKLKLVNGEITEEEFTKKRNLLLK